MFIDKAEINISAGGGGDGANSFYSDKFIRPGKKGRGRPDGGDGGRGGDVVFSADKGIHTLLDFYYRKDFSAEKGVHGSGNKKTGRSGADCLIKVPCGTLIRDIDTGCILRDLEGENETLIAVRGGAGGKGNIHADRATRGEPGEAKRVSLELKLIADVGLVGFPNAGKSTLLSVISAARPKIAAYPFTTKAPILGIVKHKDVSFVTADIPGLISDAHRGKGLGFEFLRHIERTRILIHIIDMAGVDGRSPIGDYYAINEELGLYSEKLSVRPQIVVANKMDLPEAEENLKIFKKEINLKIIPISAYKKENLAELLDAVIAKL